MTAIDVLKESYNEELPMKLLAGDSLHLPGPFLTLDDMDRMGDRFPRCKFFADVVRQWLKEPK